MESLSLYRILLLIGVIVFGEDLSGTNSSLVLSKISATPTDTIQEMSDENAVITNYCHSIRYSTCKATNFSYLICPTSQEGQNYEKYNCPILFETEETFALCSNKSFKSIDDMRIPANTTVLCLQDNKISKFGSESFKNYSKIKHLNLQRAKFSKLSETAFRGLNELVWLSLDNITVQVIPNKTFSFLPKLMRLGLSFWNPFWRTNKQRKEQLKLNCLQGLNETRISDIDLRGINPESATGVFWELEAPLFSVFKQTNLKCLALMHNQIITIRENVLNNFHKLEYLWISHNLIMGTDKNVFRFDIPKMKNLLFVDISHQNYVELKFHRSPESGVQKNRLDSKVKFQRLPEYGLVRETSDINTFILNIPPKLKLILAGFNRIVTKSPFLRHHRVQFSSQNNIEQICLQSLYLTETEISQINFFQKLKVLNLNSAKFYVTNLKIFENLTSLEYLNLASFNMDYYLTNEYEWKNFAKHLNMPKLTYLDMSGNYLKINKSSIGFFNKFPLLHSLHLGNNLFSIIPVNISNLPNLRYLGLQYNKLFTIPKKVMNEWAQFGKSHPKNKLIINLSGNTLYCSCADIGIIIDARHIKHVKLEGYFCLFPSGEKLDLLKINIKEMERRCGEDWIVFHMYVVYICYLSVILAYVIVIVSYRFRHTLMYIWYLHKYNMKKMVLMDIKEKTFEYDAYFICHPDDLVHVGPLYKTLENIYGYKLYILERDGLCGNTLFNIIKHSFSLCRNAILVISEKSMKGQCFHYVVHLAKEISDTRNAKIVCILLNKKCILESPSVTGSLEYLLCTSLCLSWEAKNSNRAVFWMRLRNYLGIPS